jgi:hypothetical protein
MRIVEQLLEIGVELSDFHYVHRAAPGFWISASLPD